MSEPLEAFPNRYVICAVGGTDDIAIQKAKDWVKEKKLTSEDVKIVKSMDDNCIMVITKRDGVIV